MSSEREHASRPYTILANRALHSGADLRPASVGRAERALPSVGVFIQLLRRTCCSCICFLRTPERALHLLVVKKQKPCSAVIWRTLPGSDAAWSAWEERASRLSPGWWELLPFLASYLANNYTYIGIKHSCNRGH